MLRVGVASVSALRSSVLARLVVAFAGAAAGGFIGLAAGGRGDALFNVDTRLVGITVGATVGSLLPLTPPLHCVAHAAAAAAGVGAAMVLGVGTSHFVPWVFWRLVQVAAVASLSISLALNLGLGLRARRRIWRAP